ncbi:MAG: hypothetical protein GY844_02865 [Bradyrhizobium sp.]|nr:hypothetical protein [Bradyrhizobium sp.]
MKKLVVAFLLLSSPTFAQNSGPLPQTGLDRPGVTKGAKESGAMDTKRDKGKGTAGMNKRSKEKNGTTK